MSEEGYKPTEEEISRAEEMMYSHQKHLSSGREFLADQLSETDMELMKKCQLGYINRQNGEEFVQGTIDGERIKLVRTTITGDVMGEINDLKLDEQDAKSLWEKFLLIAKLTSHGEIMDKDAKEKLTTKAKLTASRLLEL